MDLQKAFETNKKTWNSRISVHSASDFYNMKAFKEGECTLNAFELEALDSVEGKKILHLQCHMGQDSLSWSRRGADVVGVDFSEDAIDVARTLTDELSLNARFECCNVLDTSKFITENFDWVFSSYGTIGWLPDLEPWGKMIADRLKPGGSFYLIEFHPIIWMFDYTQNPPKLQYGYHQEEAIYEEYEGTYADPNAKVSSKEYGWNHSLGTVINALTKAGLRIDYLNEYDESPYDIFPGLIKNDNGMYHMKDGLYPLLFEIKATKPTI
jgi:SAM-dependent methyltransferase